MIFAARISTHAICKLFVRAYEKGPKDFEQLLGIPVAEESSRAIAGGGIDLWHTGQDAGPGSFRLRTWRKRSHPLPREPDDL